MNFIATLTLMTQLAEAGGGSQETVHGLASSIWITCESLGGCMTALRHYANQTARPL